MGFKKGVLIGVLGTTIVGATALYLTVRALNNIGHMPDRIVDRRQPVEKRAISRIIKVQALFRGHMARRQVS